MTNLNELIASDFLGTDLEKMEKLEKIAKNLVHLERLYNSENSTIDDFVPFIRHSKRLKELFLYGIEPLDGEALDLRFFDEERKKLAGACPISIRVREEIYLATKWSTQNLNLNHIKIERL